MFRIIQSNIYYKNEFNIIAYSIVFYIIARKL